MSDKEMTDLKERCTAALKPILPDGALCVLVVSVPSDDGKTYHNFCASNASREDCIALLSQGAEVGIEAQRQRN